MHVPGMIERQEMGSAADTYETALAEMRLAVARLNEEQRPEFLGILERIDKAVDARLSAQHAAHMADMDVC